MQITGIVKQVLPAQNGTSRNGKQWTKQTFIVETQDRYPRTIALDAFNDVCQQIPLPGSSVSIDDFEIESREFRDKWYTDIRARRIVATVAPQQSQPQQQPQQQPTQYAQSVQSHPQPQDDNGDLPF